MVKGQAFIMSSLIFSSLLVLLTVSLAMQNPQTDDAEIENFFSNSIEQNPRVFNSALTQEKSIENVRNELYSLHSFTERESQIRNTEYNALNLATLPEEGRLVIINYQNQPENISLYIDGNPIKENENIESQEFFSYDELPEEEPTVEIILNDRDTGRLFTSSTPRLFTYMRMEFEDETWVRSVLS